MKQMCQQQRDFEFQNRTANASGKMSADKLPIFVAESYKEEKKLKDKYCSKTFVSCVLAAILIALLLAVCVQFLFPVTEQTYSDSYIDTEHIYKGEPTHSQEQEYVPQLPKEPTKDEGLFEPWCLNFLINPANLCATEIPPDSEEYANNPEIKLLIMVPSATDHFDHRDTIRNTWGSFSGNPGSPMRLGFILGTTSNQTVQDMIKQESSSHGDIIQADFEDTYRNLTTKSVLMLKWASGYCPHAQYFLKADDDTFVNIGFLTKLLQETFTSDDSFIGGFVHRGAQPSRSPEEKYYVSEEDYPDDRYPPYASGAAYVTTGATVSKLFESCKGVKRPLLPMEDVFITGLCAEDIAVPLVHEPRFIYRDPPKTLDWDNYGSLITAHSVSPDNMDVLWKQMDRDVQDTFKWVDTLLGPTSLSGELSKTKPFSDLSTDLSIEKPFKSLSVDLSKGKPLLDFSADLLVNKPFSGLSLDLLKSKLFSDLTAFPPINKPVSGFSADLPKSKPLMEMTVGFSNSNPFLDLFPFPGIGGYIPGDLLFNDKDLMRWESSPIVYGDLEWSEIEYGPLTKKSEGQSESLNKKSEGQSESLNKKSEGQLESLNTKDKPFQDDEDTRALKERNKGMERLMNLLKNPMGVLNNRRNKVAMSPEDDQLSESNRPMNSIFNFTMLLLK